MARLTTRSTTMSVDVAMRKAAMAMTMDTLESLVSRRTDSSPAMGFRLCDVDTTNRQKIRADAGGRSGADGKGTLTDLVLDAKQPNDLEDLGCNVLAIF
ncbi:hypothetical protein FOXYS1_9644 [Fusarium oxysporum]|uniref:Uncharacterized protein n=1 Tax=Fusarium oxysporum TaxID=5507 RepID=A0A8H5A7X0_FUSOX|nr:hypothetical protein FOXYS1_9644 [Fusarium oxysporum]